MTPFNFSENIEKEKPCLMFLGGPKGTLGRKKVTYTSFATYFLCNTLFHVTKGTAFLFCLVLLSF